MSILSLYFLASSSPNKGDVFESEVFVCINPLALRALPLYFAAQNTGGEVETYSLFVSVPILYVKPRKATGHGRGRRTNTNNPR